ncbi:MAG: hypothetical protein DMG14_25125 [Acidobacteria bacterium]|nr:MAG: hypothetical protein DMG14_25125 [Acidobacteriota bacterium]
MPRIYSNIEKTRAELAPIEFIQGAIDTVHFGMAPKWAVVVCVAPAERSVVTCEAGSSFEVRHDEWMWFSAS